MAKKNKSSKKDLVKKKTKIRQKKPPGMRPFVVDLKRSDLKRIRRLLFMGIRLKLIRKSEKKYKVWIWRFQKLYVKARTPVSTYRKMFKRLRQEGIYLP